MIEKTKWKMVNQKGIQLRPCIISWAKFALEVENKAAPKKHYYCTKVYWKNVIDTIVSKQKYSRYKVNRQFAIDKFELVKRIKKNI